MQNTRKEKNFHKPTGLANVHTYNFMNPDGADLKFHGKEWVNPCNPDHHSQNKKNLKNIIQMNKEQVKRKEEAQAVQGKFPSPNLN